VFSLDGENSITQRALLYHFGKIIELADIPDRQTRDIVPYSFRHYFINQKLVNGLAHRQVADMWSQHHSDRKDLLSSER